MDLLRLPEPRANRKTVLKAKCFSEASFKGSNGAFVTWCSTWERFQEGMPLLPWVGLYGNYLGDGGDSHLY